MAVEYIDFISAVQNYYNAENIAYAGQKATTYTWAQVSKDLATRGINTQTYVQYLDNYPELFSVIRNENGTIVDSALKTSVYTLDPNDFIGGSLNSNTLPATVPDSTQLTIPSIPTTSTTGGLSVKGGIGLKASTGETVAGTASAVSWGVLAVATGVQLGKEIGNALYESNPNIWDEGPIKGLLGTDWGDVAVRIKDDVTGAIRSGVMALWGIDDDDTTMYVDENALASMAWYYTNSGLLNQAESGNVNVPDSIYNQFSTLGKQYISLPIPVYNKLSGYTYAGENTLLREVSVKEYKSQVFLYVIRISNGPQYGYPVSVSKEPFSLERKSYKIDGTYSSEIWDSNAYTLKGETVYITSSRTYFDIWNGNVVCPSMPYTETSVPADDIRYGILYGTYTEQGTPGITSNPNSTQFDPTGVGSVTTALGALKNQYPELWNNAVTRTNIQDDGTEDTRTYVPIPIPNFSTPTDTQPTSGDSTQTDPKVNPDTAPDGVTDANTKTPTSTDNPNTGGGDSPSIILPTQSASALWAIYNPTLAQLNSLGAWLWSSNFIDQLLKIFNDPMQAIIGLHKVYATPNISGSGNIKVGYLDSGVGSNIVGNQYTYIDCGTVGLREYYGNVLDYAPYTDVKLYLPFIGIVPLDVADVSRASISIRYGVDVLTGACLASVSVTRDSAGGVLYQYSGNCACQYPLSSGSYMGMVTGAIGAIGSLAKGNIFGSMMGVAGMHTNIEHSGGFSGNAGAMGIKKPYLIISRPQSAMNDGFPGVQGYPSNAFVTLKNCTGFTQVKDCHVDNISATDKELDKIKSALMEGVII